MNRLFAVCAVVFLLVAGSSSGTAQSRRFELAAGYSFQRTVSFRRQNLEGWNASLATKLNPWLAVVADFSGHYDADFLAAGRLPNDRFFPFVARSFMFHTALVGPQVAIREGRFKPFARALFGVARESREGGGGHTGFAWAVGGGVDWQAFEVIRIRLIQADYLRARNTPFTDENLRLSLGVVIPF